MKCDEVLRRASTALGRQALFRAQVRDSSYRGVVHLAIVVLVSFGPAAVALAMVGSWGLPAWMAVLGGVLVGTSVVYFGHRFPMHRVMPPVEIVYTMHTRCHHMLFDEDHTEIASLDDGCMILLPWRHAVALCLLGVPLLAAPWLLWGLDAALAHAAMAWLYYGLYELVHLAAHLRVGGPLDRVPGLGYLLRHHRRHHAWPLMHHGNFSMLIPLWDWVLGTKLPPR